MKKKTVIRGFLKGNVTFLLPFLIDLLIVYPTVKKFSIYIRNFLKKPNFFKYHNFFKIIEKTKKKISAEIFFKTLIDRSLDFFKNYALRFHLGISRLFGHTVYICKLINAGLKYVTIFVCFHLDYLHSFSSS
jgi:hypothetical protein